LRMQVKTKIRNRLVVEGHEDLFSVVHLMRAHINWPEKIEQAPVYIEIGKSADEILDPDYLSVLIKEPGIDVLGIMLDADTKPKGRYQRIRTVCKDAFPELPADLPASGAIVQNADRKRLGIWIMPDNTADGCLETFLRYLVPAERKVLWDHAITSTGDAKTKGSEFKDVHEDKAYLHTYLAWQDPPGQNPGIALAKKVLDPKSESAQAFVNWFKELYGL
jgi:hypothetical protein